DVTVCRLLETGNEAQAGGLARPGRAEHGEEFALGDIEGHAVDGPHRAEMAADIHEFDGWRHWLRIRGSGPTLKGRAEFCWTRYLPIMAIKSFAHCEYGTPFPSCSHLAVGVRQNQILPKFSYALVAQPVSVRSALPLQAVGTVGTEPNHDARSPCSFGLSECSSHL